jgi:hypothetical protein
LRRLSVGVGDDGREHVQEAGVVARTIQSAEALIQGLGVLSGQGGGSRDSQAQQIAGHGRPDVRQLLQEAPSITGRV